METEKRICKKCQQEFILDQDDFSFYEKMKVPVPEICPDCRFKMRAMWRNETTLYSGQKCGLCNDSIITVYNSKNNFKVFCYKCFLSDSWDAKDYAKNYNKEESFLGQFHDLFRKVPKKNLSIDLSSGPIINTSYANGAGGMKNCYMVFNGGGGEDMMYCRGIMKAKEISDCYFGENIELSYECIHINKSTGITFGDSIVGCVDCMFLKNCSGLTNCFGCVNLRNKSHCWFNEQLTRDEYTDRLKEINGSYSKIEEMKKKFCDFCLSFSNRENHNIKAIDCTGDYLFDSKNLKESFEVTESENCRYLCYTKKTNDSLGVMGFGIKSEQLLEVVSTGYSSNIISSNGIDGSQNIMYSNSLHNCHDCIGCDGLKNAEYCILNKQYSKEEYEKFKEHIVKELTELGIHGLMMPPEIAPFAYNETIAQDNMPLTKEEAIAEGFRWEDDIQMTKGKETLQQEAIHDHINEVKDEITKEILRCINCERNYKITEQELLFYRKMKLPIPRKCFFCRHQDRIKRRGPYKFWDRKCDHCGKDIKTNYSPNSPEIIYCEDCYKQEVI
ncbi:MAG: hypothetical protein WC603_02730 [Candidatus Paceibacterota bacterium]|jgi:hypothetical protein